MRFVIFALSVFLISPAMAEDGFGPMFANEPMPGLEQPSTQDLMAEEGTIAEELQQIAPAAGEEAEDAPTENEAQSEPQEETEISL